VCNLGSSKVAPGNGVNSLVIAPELFDLAACNTANWCVGQKKSRPLLLRWSARPRRPVEPKDVGVHGSRVTGRMRQQTWGYCWALGRSPDTERFPGAREDGCGGPPGLDDIK